MKYKFQAGHVAEGSDLHNEMQKCMNNNVDLICPQTLSIKDPNKISSDETNPYLQWIGVEDPRINKDAEGFWLWQAILVGAATGGLIFVAYFTYIVEKCCCGNSCMLIIGKWFLQLSSLIVIPALFALPIGGGQGRSISEITAFLACIVWFFFLATVMIAYHDYRLLRCQLGKNPVTLQYFIVIFVFLVSCMVSFAYFLYFVTINYRFSFAFSELHPDYNLCNCGCVYDVPWSTYAACMTIGLTALANLVPLLDRTKDAMIHFDQFLSLTHVVPGYLAKSVNLKNPTGLRDKWARNKLHLMTHSTRGEGLEEQEILVSPRATFVKPPGRYTENLLVKELILWFYYFCSVQAICIGVLQVSTLIYSIIYSDVTERMLQIYVYLGYALTFFLTLFAFFMLVEVCVHPRENILLKDKTARVYFHLCCCRSCLCCKKMKKFSIESDSEEESLVELAPLSPTPNPSSVERILHSGFDDDRPPSPVATPPATNINKHTNTYHVKL